MDSFNWTCPYCNTKTTIIQSTNFSDEIHFYNSPSVDKYLGLRTTFTVCPNPECREYSINASLHRAGYNGTLGREFLANDSLLQFWNLKPQSFAQPQPEYIPEPIRSDYFEACNILTASPKASATLSRRCLQGMIRGFWKISKSRLKDEIDALEDKVDVETWSAIDSLRKIGNVGAHMEKDTNLIIDVDPDEAQLLIKLIEDLFVDWYVVRHERSERYKKLRESAENK